MSHQLKQIAAREYMLSDDPLLRAIKILGSRQEIIKMLGITRQRLNAWLNGNVAMGYEYALALEHLTCGQVTATELVPEKIHVLKKLKINFNHPLTCLIRKQVPISSIKISECSNKQLNDIENLTADIKKHGLFRPIVMDANNALIFGNRRLLAHKFLEKNTIAALVLSLDMLLKDEDAGYELKRYFTLSELVAIGTALENMLGKRQGQRNDLSLRPQSDKVSTKQQNNLSHRQNLDQVKGRTDTLLAHLLKFGNKGTYRQAKKVVQTGIRQLITAMDEEKVSISAAAEIAVLSFDKQYQIMQSDFKLIKEQVKQLKLTKKIVSKKPEVIFTCTKD